MNSSMHPIVKETKITGDFSFGSWQYLYILFICLSINIEYLHIKYIQENEQNSSGKEKCSFVCYH